MDPTQNQPQDQDSNSLLQSPYSKPPFVPPKPSTMTPSFYAPTHTTNLPPPTYPSYSDPFQRAPFRPDVDGQPGISRPPPPMNVPYQVDQRPPPPSSTMQIYHPVVSKPPPPTTTTPLKTPPPPKTSFMDFEGGLKPQTAPPPKMIETQSLTAQMQKLNLEPQKPQLGNAINTFDLDALPRPTSDTMLSCIGQPDCQPLFNRYQGVDFSKVQARPQFLRATVQCVPNSPALLSKWGLPFGVIIHPFAELPDGEV